MDLINKKCVPCEGGTNPLIGAELDKYISMVRGWILAITRDTISKEYTHTDFKKAMQFVNAVAVIAEEEGHHPDILIFAYNKVKITLQTHAINGLSENDFILAAKIDELIVQ